MQSEPINQHVMVKYGKEFGDLCHPVFNITPINYIGLARIYQNGSRSYLISNPHWGEILLKNKYHLAGTEDALALDLHSNHQLWSISNMFSLNKQTQNLFRDCVANNYGNGITLMERSEHYIEFIHICANSGYEAVDPYLANNIDQLWKYVMYIREVLHKNKILWAAYNYRYHYFLDYYNNDLDLKNNKSGSSIGIKKFYLGGYFKDIYFTPREMDCLVLLCQNKSAKEQAKILNLSYRTIEHCLENIKRKSKCKNKIELIINLTKNNAFNTILKDYASHTIHWE